MKVDISKLVIKRKLAIALNDRIEPVDEKDLIIDDLIIESANDSNSSKFREDVTKYLVGLKPSESKLGYDDDELPIEVKPKNYVGKGKLNGGGNFTDMTWRRDEKYSSDGCIMLVSGFSYGELIYVVEFMYDVIRQKIQYHLKRHLPDGDIPSRYVRSASFSWSDWKHDFNIRFKSDNLADYKHCMVGGLYKLLESTDVATNPIIPLTH